MSATWAIPEEVQAVTQWPLDTLLRLFIRDCGEQSSLVPARCKRYAGHRGAHYASFVYMGMACMYDRWLTALSDDATVLPPTVAVRSNPADAGNPDPPLDLLIQGVSE